MLTNVKDKSKEFPTIEFKVALLRHRVSLTEIAKRLKVSRPLVSMVVNNLCASEKIRSFLERIFEDMKAGEFTSLDDYEA